jgi:hypothetical protein
LEWQADDLLAIMINNQQPKMMINLKRLCKVIVSILTQVILISKAVALSMKKFTLNSLIMPVQVMLKICYSQIL